MMMKKTAEHLTSANLGKAPLPTLPLPPTASESASSSYAEALIKKQEERQQIPKVDRANSTFREDTDLPEMFRARLEDYFRSGYDRGHMVSTRSQHGCTDRQLIHTGLWCTGACSRCQAESGVLAHYLITKIQADTSFAALNRKQWTRLSF